MTDDATWTFSADGEIRERWDWLSDGLAAATGPEQGRRLRTDPRVVQAFDALESGWARRWLENLIAAFGSGSWGVPIVQDATWLDDAAGPGSAVLACDTTLRRFAVGARVLIVGDDPRTFDIGTIEALDDDEITLADPPANAWPAGTPVVPLHSGRLEPAPPLSRFTADDLPVPLQFRITEPLPLEEDAGDATYRGYPVFEFGPDWSDEPTAQPDRKQLRVDVGVGPVSVIDLPEIPLGSQRVSAVLQGRAEIVAFRALLGALAGRWSPLWVPTFAQDLRVTGDLVAASALLDVEWCGLQDLELAPNRRDIRIEMGDGTVLYRRITAVAALGDDQERLTLDSALGVTAAATAVRSVSYLVFSRQDADVNLIRYWSCELAVSELVFRGVLDSGV